MSPIELREGRDSDAEGFIALIGACWGEYPGCLLDVDGEVPELRALATYFRDQGGTLWTAERAGRVIGMVGTRPLKEDAAWEICRMYVDAGARGAGLAGDLLRTAEAHARASGAQRMVLWTDTRFTRAHGFYEKHGYVRQGSIRILDDISHSLEFRYAKPAAGLVVEALDAAAAASAERRLADLLVDCVAEGASLEYLPPLSRDRATAFWKAGSAAVAAGSRVLLAAWLDGRLAGTVTLELVGSENQPHVAGIQKLMVDPAARRAGIGRALLRRAEQAARAHGRRLAMLDTRRGSAAEALYRAEGWTELGAIPGFEMDGDRRPQDTVFFWKAL
ncbi:GNAT family N-acetyltransferase [Roseomonas sp. JC162]|uniref:GNAT family N-acetyltransferase n=1 Tax=Neoroseomonas marina TaxID=1232220 RepID=A0A848E7B2_9PROT|nr:GNAT family N-acetyltransferase [Neoroseomonas marina]NMJ39996.1 GNAT family N-acetyltransferase [Neoroseomonas marina]